jgi:hypothetical protein
MTTVTITKEQEDLLRKFGSVVTVASAEYIFVPYWFRKSDEAWEVVPLDPMILPIELREFITKQRHKK